MLRTAVNFGGRTFSASLALLCPEESKTLQSEADGADINKIIARFLKTKEVPQVTVPPRFGVFDSLDFQSAMNQLNEARDLFLTLPAKFRKEFDNDPAKFLPYLHDKENAPTLRKFGLMLPEVAAPAKPEPMEVRVVNAEGIDEPDLEGSRSSKRRR